MLIVVGILLAWGFFSLPSYQNFQQANDLQMTFNLIINIATRAQTKSQSIEGDSSWGVKILTNEIILFKGVNYDARDVSADEKTKFSATITVSPGLEVVFNKLTGYPSATVTATLTNGLNQTKIFSINERGAIY